VEHTVTDPTSNTSVAEVEFDLDEWLSTGTLARRSVEIYNDPSLAAEFDELDRRLKAVQVDDADPEATMGTPSEATEILAAMDELHERWEASKATWVVRALTEDEVKAIIDEHPDPEIPPLLAEKREEGAAVSEERLEAGRVYMAAREAVVTERNLAMIARAVVEVRVRAGVARGVTLEQVRRLRERPHGKLQATRLLEAVESATSGEVDVPRPTWPGRSEAARG